LQRHESFVGRAGLLDRLDQLLVDSEADRWVVITGGPGMGKSAVLAAWLARRQAAGAIVPHHFIRRGMYDWDDARKLVGSLVAQLEDGFPDLREPDGEERMHPATRLARALSRVSDSVLRTRGACPTSNRTVPACERATLMRCSSGSMPTTLPLGTSRSAIHRARRPVPHPTSSTRAPSSSPSRSTRRLPPSNWKSLTRS